jgi:hypothetical protein
MKFRYFLILFTIFILSNSLISQNDKWKRKMDLKNLSFYNLVTKESDKNFGVKMAPAKWKDESFVFLAISSYLTVGSRGTKTRGVNRKRVLLQDKNAVEKFAEFYFQNSETTILNVIKKNGDEIEVDLKDAVKVTTSVPSYYYGRFQSSESSKLAIPNLEVGDILDYTNIYTDNYYKRIEYSDIFTTSEPILYQSLIFDVKNEYDVYKNTYNTPTKFVLQKSKGCNFEGVLDQSMNRFSLEIKDLEGQMDEPMINSYEIEPLVKFMALPKSDDPYHSNEDIGLIKEELNIDNLVKQFFRDSKLNDPYISSLLSSLLSEMNSNKSLTTKKEKANASYYYLRDQFMHLTYGPLAVVDNVKNFKYTYEDIYRGYTNALDEQLFLACFAKLLNKYDIDAEVVGIVPSMYGKMTDALSFNEVYFGIYVPETKAYYFPPNRDRTAADYPTMLLTGGLGKSINVNEVKKETSGKSINLAPCKFDDNMEINNLSIIINSDNTLGVNQTTTTKGYLKNGVYGLIEEFGDNLYEDYLSMFPDDSNAKKLVSDYNKNLLKNKKGIYQDFLTKSDANLLKNVKEWVEVKDRKVVVDSFELISSGRTFVNPNHEIQVKFTTDGFIKKVGPNLIFDMGLLVGSQIQIEEKFKINRNSNIDLGIPRTFKYVVDITLPEGYLVDGLNNLVKSRENEFCSFISTAVQEGNIIKLTTTKSYKQQFVGKEHWKAINEILDEAYKYSQEKVVLKKK